MFQQEMNYIHQNPVFEGFVSEAKVYLFSNPKNIVSPFTIPLFLQQAKYFKAFVGVDFYEINTFRKIGNS